MSSAASLLQGQGSHRTVAPVRVPLEVLQRRAGQRRQMLAVQGVSYALITSVLLVYCYAGTVPIIIPSAYFLPASDWSRSSSCCRKPISTTGSKTTI
jgi:hypothetical protein